MLLPAYISWQSFLDFLDGFGSDAPEVRQDLFRGMAPSTASQLRQALRFLGLITITDEVTSDLKNLIRYPSTRARLMAKLLHTAYPGVFDPVDGALVLPLAHDFILETKLSRATQSKATNFLKKASAFSGLPLRTSIQGTSDSVAEVVQRVKFRRGGYIEIRTKLDPGLLDALEKEFYLNLEALLGTYTRQNELADEDRELLEREEWSDAPPF